jgi:HD-like signal output (HDOD) protein
MNSSPRQLIQDIVDSLPPLNTTVLELVRMAGDPSTSAGDAERVIMRDGLLLGTVLREANSAAVSPRSPVTTAHDAVALLGMNRVVALAVSAASRTSLPTSVDSYGVDADSLRDHHLIALETVLVLGRHLPAQQRSELATIAVLHDMGKLILSALGPGWLTKIGMITASDAIELTALERDLFDVHHGTVGRMMCDHWGIADHIGAAVEHHHHPQVGDPLSCGVYLADLAATVIDPDHGEPIDDAPDLVAGALSTCGLRSLDDVVDRVRQRLERAAGATL